MDNQMTFLDRNEFNYAPSSDVVEAYKNFDINKLCFYTRIYDEGKKSILSVFLSDLYGVDESQVLLGYGGEDILKQAVHYFLTRPDGNKKMLIPRYSWWYYKSIADEVGGTTMQYALRRREHLPLRPRQDHRDGPRRETPTAASRIPQQPDRQRSDTGTDREIAFKHTGRDNHAD